MVADCAAGLICSGGECTTCQAQGCSTDVGSDKKTCDQAAIIGRTNAQTGFLVLDDTTGAGNNDDLSTNKTACWDAKYDHFYRIWMLAGETIAVTASPMEFEFNLMLKLYQGTQCDSNKDTLLGCTNDGGDGKAEEATWVANQDGWVSIVVDGRRAFTDDYDWGEYAIHVQLTCNEAGCCCQ